MTKGLLYFSYCNNVVFNTTGEHTWQSVTRLFGYSREDLPCRNTFKNHIIIQNDVCQGWKEKKECPRECPFAGSFSRDAYFAAERQAFSNIVPKLWQSFIWKVHLCELITCQLCIPLSGKCLKYAFFILLPATALAKYRNLSKNCDRCTDRYLFLRESGDRMQYTSVLVGKFLLHIQTRVIFLCNWWQILLGKLGIYTSKKSLQRFLSIFHAWKTF